MGQVQLAARDGACDRAVAARDIGRRTDSGHQDCRIDDNRCPLLLRKRLNSCVPRNDAMGHVWTAPGWQELSSRLQHWSVQPCVRPVSAVHLTAGHNALRGSGPGQKHAFENSVARVGCPDHRIDRFCITCCSPSQPLHHAGQPRSDLVMPRARLVPCTARPSPSWPRPCGRVCWRARWPRPWSDAAPATR
jgi:hypothetical protein